MTDEQLDALVRDICTAPDDLYVVLKRAVEKCESPEERKALQMAGLALHAVRKGQLMIREKPK